MRIGLGIGIGSGSGGGGGGTLINPPALVLSSFTTYPPPLLMDFDETVIEGDVVRLQASTSAGFGSTVFNQTNTIDAAEMISGNLVFAGLGTITSPAQTFFRARVERGASISAWSTIIKHGDTTAPTITSAASASRPENTPNPTGTLTANEDILSWAIAGGADAASFSISGNVWTLNVNPDFETKNSYAVQFLATDYAGNTATQSFVVNITDVFELTPTTISSGSIGLFLTLSNGNLTVESQTIAVGAPSRFRANQARTGKFYMEFTINARVSGAQSRIHLGAAATTTTIPGEYGMPTASEGVWLRDDGYIYPGTTDISLPYAVGDIVSVAFDATARKIWFAVNGVFNGNPAAGTGGQTLPSTTNDYFIWGGLIVADGPNRVTANFGATAFAHTIPSGFGAYL